MRSDREPTVRRPTITPAMPEPVRFASPEATLVCRTLPAKVLPSMQYEAVRDALEPGWEPEVGTFAWHIAMAKRHQALIAAAAKGGAR